MLSVKIGLVGEAHSHHTSNIDNEHNQLHSVAILLIAIATIHRAKCHL